MLNFYRDHNSRIVGVYQREPKVVLAIRLDADGLKNIVMGAGEFARKYTHPVTMDPRKAVRTWFCRALTKSRNDLRAFQLIEEMFMTKQLNEMTMEELVEKHNEIATDLGKPTVESFKSLKAARTAVEKLTAPAKEPKAKKPAANPETLGRGPVQGIGAYAKGLLLEGMTNKEVLASVQENFPSAKTSASCIAFYRTKLIAEGKLVSSRAPKAEAVAA